MGHSMRNLHPKIFFRKKYVLLRSMLKNSRHVFFSIGYSKKSLRYKKFLLYGKCP